MPVALLPLLRLLAWILVLPGHVRLLLVAVVWVVVAVLLLVVGMLVVVRVLLVHLRLAPVVAVAVVVVDGHHAVQHGKLAVLM